MVIYLSIYENICWYVWEAWMSRVLPFLVVNHFTTWKDGGATVLSDVLKDTPSTLTEPCLTALELMKCLGISRCKPIPSIGCIKRWYVYLQFGWFFMVNVGKYHTWIMWATHLCVFGGSTPKRSMYVRANPSDAPAKKTKEVMVHGLWVVLGSLTDFCVFVSPNGVETAKIVLIIRWSFFLTRIFLLFLTSDLYTWQGLIMSCGKTSSRNRWMKPIHGDL